ncbi:phenylacetic acid degradation operon negative regulatory protein PaaX [Ammoniphilus sp. 3BR4]|uniref:phenylacetic acid degradation operon negative regulatory protein PaaX n=1 Tax=Ammoniphilus sp. 3BR4 TaxID=3158265 RepID=UPI0034663F0F
MKPRSLLFTIFGLYIRDYGSEIWIGSLTRLMTPFGFTEQAVRAAISRMFRQEWIESRKIGNKSYYSMTPRGVKRLEEAAARIYRRDVNQWDGTWNIVSYSIPEKNRELRDQLRKELSWLGFGMLSSSTWISPNKLTGKVEDLIDAYDLKGYVEIFASAHQGSGEPRSLIERCWNLEEINGFYQAFIDEYKPRFEDFKQKKWNAPSDLDSFCFIEKTQMVHQYRKSLFIDPNLPKELLPDYWLGETAARLFEEYDALLDPGAKRFFNEVLVTPNDKELCTTMGK